MATKDELIKKILELDGEAKTKGMNVASLETLLGDLQAAAKEAAAAAAADEKMSAPAKNVDNGSLVIAYGKSIYCRKGFLREGTPVAAKYFAGKGELSEHLKRGTVSTAEQFKKAQASAKANPER